MSQQTPAQMPQTATVPLASAGNVLICLRKERGLSQQELAQRLGVSQQAVGRWESENYQRATLTNLVRVAHALNVDIYLKTDVPNVVGWRYPQARVGGPADHIIAESA